MNNTEESSPLMNNLQRLGSRLAIVVGVISGVIFRRRLHQLTGRDAKCAGHS
ncbi:hypothetical protein VITFI_CDS2171 [Vitreoscilla filiformis]|uniref:Uncharacterized protein n=1 Tax=Vitreoscilla filiformis TaxID=63 RepID=A0A221KG90_VITFI|nr:hypothetical protein [Vitreoscilla filiformis]ASM77949.1 hypothetical protein VITFI_CDS2171 [Vitreoscilla filiformis]